VPPPEHYPEGADGVRDELADAADGEPVVDAPATAPKSSPEASLLDLETPAQWRGVPIPPRHWLATN
jgi:hypothetical protein